MPPDTGIVNKNVQPAEVRERLLNDFPHLFGIGYVERQWKHRISKLLLQVGNVSKLACGSGDPIAAFQSGFSPNAAERERRR